MERDEIGKVKEKRQCGWENMNGWGREGKEELEEMGEGMWVTS